MASTDARPLPLKNTAFRAYFDLRLNTGALNPGAAGLDSEVSKDGGTMTDCTNEATEIATSSGHYFLDLTATEMNADSVVVQVKSTTTNAVTRTLIIYPAETGDVKVDIDSYRGTASPAADTAGYPKVTIKSGTGTGEISLTSGVAAVNPTQINGNANAATRLSLAARAMHEGTVDTTGFTPTASEFETSSITEATAQHYVGRLVLWNSGALLEQQALITAYSLVSGRGHFTVSSMTEAPANGDAFIIC